MADLSNGSVFAGHRIDGQAGKGGMGVVYRATDLRLDRPVALKVVGAEFAQNHEFAQRFKRESRLAASLDHPNVIPIYHAGEEDGLLYVTMRFVEGTDLAGVLRRDRRLDPERAVAITAQVAAALDAAHARGLVHRDVKPANILLDGDHVFLTDFGLSKNTSSETGLTETGTFMGTVDYIAPEQAQGANTDGRSDVYALGCVLFQMLAGHVPFEKPNVMAKLWAHVNELPPSLADAGIPADLAAVVQRAMEKDPGRRFQTAGDLARAAAGAIGMPLPSSVASGASGTSSLGGRRPRRASRRVLWPALALVAIAAAAGIAALAAGGGGSPSSHKADRSAITAVIARIQRGNDPSVCSHDMTQGFLEGFYSPRRGKQALLACKIEYSGSPPSTEPLVIRDVKIGGNLASAVVTLSRQPVTLYFARRDGRWRANDFAETAKIRYQRQLSVALTAPFVPAKQMEAVIRGRARLEDAGRGPADAVRVFAEGVRQLQRIKPAKGFEDLHGELVAATAGMKQAAQGALAAQKSRDARGFAAAERRLARALTRFADAEGAIGRAQ